jgi:GR25 family glycosyltransferase involved in LPS biosynthesis
MKSVEIVAGGKTYSILESIRDGILFNCKIGTSELIKIILEPIDYCANINIWDIQLIKPKEFVKISWDQTYIINLKRRPDRKEIMKEKLKKIGIENYEFINGVDGQLEKILNEFSKRGKKTRITNSGHFGCILSHIKVIKNAIKNGYKKIMVLEDDIEFIENFMDLIKNIEVPVYDILYLGGPIREYKLFTNYWGIHNEIMGTYGYIINCNMYKELLEKFSLLKYSADITMIEYIQSNYKTILLNDMIKTKIDDSDTSCKTMSMDTMVTRLNKSFYLESNLEK